MARQVAAKAAKAAANHFRFFFTATPAARLNPLPNARLTRLHNFISFRWSATGFDQRPLQNWSTIDARDG